MRYLGIDPGTTLIGYGVIDDVGGTPRWVTHGVFRNPGHDDAADKLATAHALAKLIEFHKPDRAAVEKLFLFKNKKSVMGVSEMRGVIMLTLAEQKVPVIELTPLQVKQRICGHGRAEKHQVQKMMKLLLRLTEKITPDDAADALALALCCAVAPREY